MSTQLPDVAKKMIDARAFAIVATIMPDGMPQNSIVWAGYDGDDILMSTIEGRAKPRNWRRDPRASVLLFDSNDPQRYVEIRGAVTMTRDGGPELIERLSQAYEGAHFTGDDGTDHVRLVVRLTPERVIVR